MGHIAVVAFQPILTLCAPIKTFSFFPTWGPRDSKGYVAHLIPPCSGDTETAGFM